MSVTIAITRRELGSYLYSPVGYLLPALFLFFTSLIYFAAAPLLVGSGFSQGQPASLRMFFEVGVWVFFIVGPAISMRTISDEVAQGTIETLMTAPVTDSQVIVGKFFGAFGFLVIMLLPTLLYVVILELYGRPDYGELLCGYLGMLLVGAASIASGILASALTRSQMLAYFTTLFFWLVVMLATMLLPFLASLTEGLAGRPDNSPVLELALSWLGNAAGFLAAGNPITRVRGFLVGLVDTFNIVYFVSFTTVFLVVAVRALGLRRWP